MWSAKNELIDRDVALKVMAPEVAEDAVALQRFFNEARASGRVRSPSIVEILDLGQAEDGSPFLVFELLVGEGLDERLRREGIVAPEALVELFVGIVRALDMAHQQIASSAMRGDTQGDRRSEVQPQAHGLDHSPCRN